MAISDEELFCFCHLLCFFIRTETPNGLRPRRNVYVNISVRFCSWSGTTEQLLGLLSFGKGLGGRRGSWSFWTLSLSSNVEYRGRVNAECHKTLVAFSRHLLPEDAEGVGDLLGELDTFFGNVALGLQASGGA